jgi:1-deoxy-D-xylulose-5-phosphate reductoisomerase
VGIAGLSPTYNMIKNGKTVALANKEVLVAGGELIMKTAKESGATLLTVDSEHSAIMQCLRGEEQNPIDKILLTASGGPFFDKEITEDITPADALNHPTWSMGPKVTIDSSTMMNKGFEVIEAKWLFDLNIDQIDVLVHPQSIVHSMVQFKDGSVKAQLGLPDMRLPIAYALSYPNRLENNYERLDFLKFNQLTFEKPDIERFRNLGFAFEAMKQGGNMPCILNAANEIAVYGFLHDKISFLGMSDLIEWAMTNTDFIASPTYEDYVATDSLVRKITSEKIGL